MQFPVESTSVASKFPLEIVSGPIDALWIFNFHIFGAAFFDFIRRFELSPESRRFSVAVWTNFVLFVPFGVANGEGGLV